MNGEPCKCGCGEIASKQSHYLPGHALRGRKHSQEWIAKRVPGIIAAHKRGAYKAHHANQKKETLARRPLCKCGCGKPVKKAESIYFSNECLPAGGAERMKIVAGARDMDKLRPKLSKLMTERMKGWAGTEEWEAMRQECRTARGMPDHISAKEWVIRDPFGKVYKFSNLTEWSRQNEWRFEDDHPESKMSFCRRIGHGICATFASRGKSCSYRGWTPVSKMEQEDGGKDLLARNCELLNPKKENKHG
jgi:hypothetical protein